MSKNILFTHTDLDGVGCVVLAKLFFKDDIEIVYCKNPQECSEKILEVFEETKFKDYSQIFVTDMSFNESILEDKKLYKILKNRCRIFDHHATAYGLRDKLPLAVIMEQDKNGKNMSGTYLFHEYLISKGMAARSFFVELIRSYDTWDWSKGSSQLANYLNILLFGKGRRFFVDSFVAKLERKDINELNIFSQYERDILEFEIDRNERDIQKNLSNVMKIKTDSYTIGLVNMTTGDYSALGNRICEVFDVDIACMFDVTTGRLSLRTTREDINLGQLLTSSDFVGGGHYSSAGGNLGKEFAETIANEIVEKLVGEKVKENLN